MLPRSILLGVLLKGCAEGVHGLDYGFQLVDRPSVLTLDDAEFPADGLSEVIMVRSLACRRWGVRA